MASCVGSPTGYAPVEGSPSGSMQPFPHEVVSVGPPNATGLYMLQTQQQCSPPGVIGTGGSLSVGAMIANAPASADSSMGAIAAAAPTFNTTVPSPSARIAASAALAAVGVCMPPLGGGTGLIGRASPISLFAGAPAVVSTIDLPRHGYGSLDGHGAAAPIAPSDSRHQVQSSRFQPGCVQDGGVYMVASQDNNLTAGAVPSPGYLLAVGDAIIGVHSQGVQPAHYVAVPAAIEEGAGYASHVPNMPQHNGGHLPSSNSTAGSNISAAPSGSSRATRFTSFLNQNNCARNSMVTGILGSLTLPELETVLGNASDLPANVTDQITKASSSLRSKGSFDVIALHAALSRPPADLHNMHTIQDVMRCMFSARKSSFWSWQGQHLNTCPALPIKM